jgi:hypothetical protein
MSLSSSKKPSRISVRVFLFLAGEHGDRTHLTVLTHGDNGFEGRDGHQLRNLSLVMDKRANGKLKIGNPGVESVLNYI